MSRKQRRKRESTMKGKESKVQREAVMNTLDKTDGKGVKERKAREINTRKMQRKESTYMKL